MKFQAKYIVLSLFMAFGTTAFASNMMPVKPTKNENTDSVYMRKLMDAAKAGDADSQNKLGNHYYMGVKVAQNYSAAAKWYSLAAKQNHVVAIANLGLCFQMGHGVKKDSLEAVKLYEKSVAAGNSEFVAQRVKAVKENKNAFDVNLLAEMYDKGCGSTVKKDMNEALKYYKIAADVYGNSDACMKIASQYDLTQSYREALSYYQTAAKSGNAMANYKCGEYLVKGKGVAVDKAKGAIYLSRAAEMQNTNAIVMLGDLNYKGDGVNQNYEKAMQLYKQAASKNRPDAMWNLGIMYRDGKAVSQNYLTSIIWMSKAVALGMKKSFESKYADANVEINSGWKGTEYADFIAAMNQVDGPVQNFDAALKTFKALEKKGHNEATTMIGRCYADKTWKKANEKKMLEAYKKAADAGDAYANYLLSQFYREGGKKEGANKELVLAYCKKAANDNFAPALCELGDMYYNGKFVSKNVTEAIKLYNQAYLNGYLSLSAAENLSNCVAQGLGGVKKDIERAAEIKKMGQAEMPWVKLFKTVSL